MKRFYLFLSFAFLCIYLYAQRATGYGRGSDYTSSGGKSDIYVYLFWICAALVVIIAIFIYSLITDRKPRKCSIVSIVKNGKEKAVVFPTSSDLRIVKSWSFWEFRGKFHSVSTSSNDDRIVKLIFFGQFGNTEVEVSAFYYDLDSILSEGNSLRIVKLANGRYQLYKK